MVETLTELLDNLLNLKDNTFAVKNHDCSTLFVKGFASKFKVFMRIIGSVLFCFVPVWLNQCTSSKKKQKKKKKKQKKKKKKTSVFNKLKDSYSILVIGNPVSLMIARMQLMVIH